MIVFLYLFILVFLCQVRVNGFLIELYVEAVSLVPSSNKNYY